MGPNVRKPLGIIPRSDHYGQCDERKHAFPEAAAAFWWTSCSIHGTDTAFCVPGESYLAVLDALYDARERVRLIVCRQEGGAAFMAEAYGKLTGKPGICFVTRGPGRHQRQHRRAHRVSRIRPR